MTFAEQLNNYMKNLKCSSSDLVAEWLALNMIVNQKNLIQTKK